MERQLNSNPQDITLRSIRKLSKDPINSDSDPSLQYDLSPPTSSATHKILTSNLLESDWIETIFLADEEYERIEEYLSSYKTQIRCSSIPLIRKTTSVIDYDLDREILPKILYIRRGTLYLTDNNIGSDKNQPLMSCSAPSITKFYSYYSLTSVATL